uniref:Uncharacterized protein n=1 Tax=Opuntia streptacantha TaxID=393608 RepID=A0A7C9DEZ6_OPUST
MSDISPARRPRCSAHNESRRLMVNLPAFQGFPPICEFVTSLSSISTPISESLDPNRLLSLIFADPSKVIQSSIIMILLCTYTWLETTGPPSKSLPLDLRP